jgi:hypothetical protein
LNAVWEGAWARKLRDFTLCALFRADQLVFGAVSLLGHATRWNCGCERFNATFGAAPLEKFPNDALILVQSRSELDKLGYRCDGHIRRHRLHIDLNRHNSASQGQQSNVRGVDLPGCTVSVWPAPGRQARTRKQEMP